MNWNLSNHMMSNYIEVSFLHVNFSSSIIYTYTLTVPHICFAPKKPLGNLILNFLGCKFWRNSRCQLTDSIPTPFSKCQNCQTKIKVVANWAEYEYYRKFSKNCAQGSTNLSVNWIYWDYIYIWKTKLAIALNCKGKNNPGEGNRPTRHNGQDTQQAGKHPQVTPPKREQKESKAQATKKTQEASLRLDLLALSMVPSPFFCLHPLTCIGLYSRHCYVPFCWGGFKKNWSGLI